jgi:GTP-binding protein LepA
MDQFERDRLKEYLELSGLWDSVKDYYKESKAKSERSESLVSNVKLMFANFAPSNEESKDLLDYFNQESKTVNGKKVLNTQDFVSIKTPSQLPDPSQILSIYEPFLLLEVITPTDYTGKILELINENRGEVEKMNSISLGQLQITCKIPLAEVITNFYDRLKSDTKGYASMSYTITDYQKTDLVKIDTLLNGKSVDPLSVICHRNKSEELAKRVCSRLKELIPRQQVEVAIQAAIGSRIIARETIKPFRKDVTAKLYGGDISRRMKLLDKQKKGKKRMKTFANVEVPSHVFLDVLKQN